MFTSDTTYETLLLIALAAKSKMPLSESIRLTLSDKKQARNSRSHRSLLRFAELIDTGIDPRKAVRQAGFSKSLVEILEASLESGDFADSLEEICTFETTRRESYYALQRALAYPLLIIFFLLLLCFLCGLWIMPSFAKLFRDFDTELPALTMLVLSISQALAAPAFWIALFLWFFLSWLLFRFLAPRALYSIPLIGPVFLSVFATGFLNRLGLLINRGKPLGEAFRLCAKTTRGAIFRYDCRRAAEDADRGLSLPEIVLRYPCLFPLWLAPIVHAAQNDNLTIAISLCRAAESLEEQKRATVAFFESLIIPLLYFPIIFMVFILILAMFLPMIKLITSLS